jgi:hypothetical protein
MYVNNVTKARIGDCPTLEDVPNKCYRVGSHPFFASPVRCFMGIYCGQMSITSVRSSTPGLMEERPVAALGAWDRIRAVPMFQCHATFVDVVVPLGIWNGLEASPDT